jgi:hypothetical protein
MSVVKAEMFFCDNPYFPLFWYEKVSMQEENTVDARSVNCVAASLCRSQEWQQ